MRLSLVLTLLLGIVWMTPTGSAAATCSLTPLALPLFDGTPIAQLATPSASPGAVQLDNEEAKDVLEMYVACTNTGNPTLVWAMFTPRWFSVEFADSEEHYMPAFEYEIANGENEVVNPLILDSVDQVVQQPDGRWAVTATFSSGKSTWTDQLILVNIDGQWLIDEVVLVSPAA